MIGIGLIGVAAAVCAVIIGILTTIKKRKDAK